MVSMVVMAWRQFRVVVGDGVHLVRLVARVESYDVGGVKGPFLDLETVLFVAVILNVLSDVLDVLIEAQVSG